MLPLLLLPLRALPLPLFRLAPPLVPYRLTISKYVCGVWGRPRQRTQKRGGHAARARAKCAPEHSTLTLPSPLAGDVARRTARPRRQRLQLSEVTRTVSVAAAAFMWPKHLPAPSGASSAGALSRAPAALLRRTATAHVPCAMTQKSVSRSCSPASMSTSPLAERWCSIASSTACQAATWGQVTRRHPCQRSSCELRVAASGQRAAHLQRRGAQVRPRLRRERARAELELLLGLRGRRRRGAGRASTSGRRDRGGRGVTRPLRTRAHTRTNARAGWRTPLQPLATAARRRYPPWVARWRGHRRICARAPWSAAHRIKRGTHGGALVSHGRRCAGEQTERTASRRTPTRWR